VETSSGQYADKIKPYFYYLNSNSTGIYCRIRSALRTRGWGQRTQKKAPTGAFSVSQVIFAYEQPEVEPQVAHFMQVPLRTSVKFPHSPQASPS
jgi:hypothetical protein